MVKPEEIIEKIVTEYAKEHNFAKYNLEIVPTTSDGANFTTLLYNVTITEGSKIHYLFAKVAAMSDKLRMEFIRHYETEIYAYTKLAKIYEKLQNIHQIPSEYRFAFPKFYGCNHRYREETIILENLLMNGYQSSFRLKDFGWEYAKSVVRELAKMHALAFAYTDYNSKEYHEIIENYKYSVNLESAKKSCFFDKAIAKVIEFVAEENKNKLKRYFQSFKLEKLGEFNSSTQKHVIGHGNCRTSNLLHRIRDEGTVDIKIVDLQTLQGSSPVVDLLYFIFTGSDKQFRDQYYEKLLDHYYTELEEAMKRLHLNPDKVYSRTDFEQDLKEKLPFGLTIAVFTLPIITADVENAPKVNEDIELSSFSVGKTSDLYVARLNGIVNDFVKWGILK